MELLAKQLIIPIMIVSTLTHQNTYQRLKSLCKKRKIKSVKLNEMRRMVVFSTR
jgi:hypothetical protein